MKKILSMALCALTICSVNAQKTNVEAAKKLAGKIDKIGDARALLKEAKENPETANDANTYLVAGTVEFKALDKAKAKQMIKPDDKDVNVLDMADQAVKGYEEMVAVLPLDVNDPKKKLSSDALKQINGHFQDYWTSAISFYNEKKFYPEAYTAFMIHGTLPKSEMADKKVALTPDSIVNQSLYNAGQMAFTVREYQDAAKAFKLARMNNTDNPDNYIYELACWQSLASSDSTFEEPSRKEIYGIASEAYGKFGMTQPIFLNNLVNSLVFEDKMDDAVALVNSQIEKTPDIASLYGLLGFIYDRKGDDEASVKAYRKAASLPGVDADNLKLIAKKLYRVGASMRDKLTPGDNATKQLIKTDYLEAAKSAALKAKELSPDTTHDLDAWIENIDYALETYFK